MQQVANGKIMESKEANGRANMSDIPARAAPFTANEKQASKPLSSSTLLQKEFIRIKVNVQLPAKFLKDITKDKNISDQLQLPLETSSIAELTSDPIIRP